MIRTRMTTRSTDRPRRPAPADGPATRPGGVPTDDGRWTTGQRGFTLIELMVVVIILAILMALLLPAITGALRTSRNAAVQAEINQLAQALADFKSKYGDYPPSRVYLAENGDYSAIGNTTTAPGLTGDKDITIGQLAQRTLAAFRKFWPRVQLSTSGYVFPANSTVWYDFNGNGVMDGPYVLQGHECLVFFLGGIPVPSPIQASDAAAVQFGVSGFGKDPTNPFSNSIVASTMYNANRQQPFYQFTPARLFLDPNNPTFSNSTGYVLPGIPGYYDTINTGPPGTGTSGFYVYFSAYGSNNYDPNDVNFTESNTFGSGPIALQYFVNFPTNGGTAFAGQGRSYIALSPSPNPYSSTRTAFTKAEAGSTSGTVSYQNPQTFQIFSPGVDGLYGVGGLYDTSPQSASSVTLPFDPVHTFDLGNGKVESDKNVRQYEHDNLTNFKSGILQ